MEFNNKTKKDFNFQEGEILLVDKPLEWTSFDVVNFYRKLISKVLKIRRIKIGHAGTLDPLATGLLILCTGKFTKKIDQIQAKEKEYTGTFTLGATTPSYDKETEVDNTFPTENLSEAQILEATKQFIGTIEQIPPIFSAKKINGKRAYEYARKKDETIKMQAKTISIKEFEITKINIPFVDFRVICGKGTYIRSLAYDFGKALNNGAHLSSLCRTKIGDYSLNNAYEIQELKKKIVEFGERKQDVLT
jgi:tRNA pseudouridine55 synthase